ncbi:MAG: hypothetical protein GXO86_15250 [Chlorobi bacterium]|nr:hypothetical protein [Chlorobiota bacterium]
MKLKKMYAAEKLDRITEIARENQFDTILSQVASLRTMLEENDYVEVVVLGQFKAGKSSLINSFLKKPVLPVGVLPVTAVITRLFYGNEKKAWVEKLNGKRAAISVGQLGEYITEKNNPENKKQVFRIDISLPELKAFEKLRFIDTPGLGSVFAHNTEVTKNWYKNIGAAIVVVSATQPLSENDIELIRAAVEQSPEVYLIVSKTDLMNDGELKDILTFIKERTKEVFNKEFRVFPYSSMVSDGDHKKQIIKGIFKKLSEQAPETNRRIVDHKLRYLTKLTRSYLEIRLNLQNKKEEERKELKDKIIDQQLKLGYVKKELAYITENYKTTTRTKLEDELTAKYHQGLNKKLSGQLAVNYEEWKGNLSKVTGEYEAWIREAMATAMKNVENSERDFMQGYLDEVREHFNNYLSGFRERLNQNLQKAIGVSIPEDDFEIEVKTMEKANISVSWAFESHIDLLWFLIPMSLFRETFRKYFLKQIPFEVEKNLRRLVSLLTNNLNNQIDELHQQSLNYITSELDKIRDVLDAPVSGSDDVREQMKLLKS